MSLFKKQNPLRREADTLYGAIVASARREVLYTSLQVPDTIDGRFDMLIFHSFPIVDRLAAGNAHQRALAQTLTDTLFADMDRGLRQAGVSDLGVAKRVRKMAEVYYGRVMAYAKALKGDDPQELEQVVARNIFSEPPEERARALTLYMRAQYTHLSSLDPDALASGKFVFLEASDEKIAL